MLLRRNFIINPIMPVTKLQILFILVSLLPLFWGFTLEEAQVMPTHLPTYEGNYSRNMTQQELNTIIMAIGAAERKTGEYQYGVIAESISKELQAAWNSPWSVIVFGKGVQQVGVGVQSKSNKAAAYVRTGIYQLTYVMYAKNPLSCSHYDTSMTVGSTEKRQYWSPGIGPVIQSNVHTVLQSTASYSGDDAQKSAQYIQNHLTQINHWPWNGVVVAPATVSGAYFCAQTWFGMIVNSYEFGWSYYVFSGGQ